MLNAFLSAANQLCQWASLVILMRVLPPTNQASDNDACCSESHTDSLSVWTQWQAFHFFFLPMKSCFGCSVPSDGEAVLVDANKLLSTLWRGKTTEERKSAFWCPCYSTDSGTSDRPAGRQWAPSLLGAFFFYVIGYFEALSSFICTAVRQQSCYVTVSLVVAVVLCAGCVSICRTWWSGCHSD